MSELPPETYLEAALRLMPRWMRGENFDKLWTSAFGMFDLANSMARQAALQASIRTCADDAVPYHIRARLMEPIESETVDEVRDRGDGAWDFWTELGNTAGLQNALRVYMEEPGIYVYDEASDGWITGGIGESYGDDTTADNASRLAIVVEQPHRWEVPVVGPDLVVGPETLVGITMTRTELSRFRRVFRKHRPSHLVGTEIVIIFDSTTAADILATRDATADLIRLPLQCTMVGYQIHGMTVGPALKVGQEFT